MISCSDEFKALWHKKIGNVERTRIRYKRRYWTGSAFALEAEWGVLEENEFVGIGRIAQALDVPFRNIFRISNVTLRFPNLYNEWLETTGAPSFFAADGVATEGYELHRSLFQVQHGYRLADGTWEWLSVFTGVALRARITGRGAEAAVEVAGMAYLLEKADAEEVRDTDVTLEDCIPPTGDGSNTDFESTSVGVDHGTDLQANAVSLTKGSGWKTSNENQLAAAGNTGRLAIKLAAAPDAGHTVKVSLVKWLRDQAIETLLGLLFDVAGIPEADRSIAPIVFPGSVSGSVGVDAQAEWEAGGTLQNVDTESNPGSIRRLWHKVDDFTDGDYTAAPVWAAGGTGWSVVAGVLTGSSPSHSIILNLTLPKAGTRSFEMVRSSGFIQAELFGQSGFYIPESTHPHSIVVRYDGAFLALLELDKNGTTVNEFATANMANPGLINVSVDADGNMKVYTDGDSLVRLEGSITLSEWEAVFRCHTSGGGTLDDVYFSDAIERYEAPSAAAVVYESEEFDLLAAPSAWGTLDYSETLNGGTVTYKTNVAGAPGGPYDGWVAINSGTRAIESALKRYFKVQVTINPAASIGSIVTPVVHSWLANFSTTTVYVSLANHRGRKCLAQVERYLRTADYELAFRGDGAAVVRAKTTDAEPVIELDQENGIIDVLAYDTGIPERVVNAARVRHGGFVSVYDGAAAGEASPTSEERFGRVVQDDDLSDVALAVGVNLAASRARVVYENSRRSATDPRPPRRLRLKVWIIPWLELGDVVRVAFYDNPYMRQFLAADPLHRVGPYYNMGDPGNVLAKDEDFKVLEYAPDYDTRTAELLVEELSA